MMSMVLTVSDVNPRLLTKENLLNAWKVFKPDLWLKHFSVYWVRNMYAI